MYRGKASGELGSQTQHRHLRPGSGKPRDQRATCGTFAIRWRTARRPPKVKDYLIVATTRPETMLGDTAVAVNPEDPRYKALIGSTSLPLVNRLIPIVADEHADMEKGTGCVKSPRPTTSTTMKWANATTCR